MGAINYGTSDYITMGIKPLDFYDIEQDTELMKELQNEVAEYGGTIEEATQSYINNCNDADYENAKYIIDSYDFNFYSVKIKPGYYDGFYIDIEKLFTSYGYYEDKRDAQKEITQIKKMLIELAGVGIVSVSPGWCTGYSDYKETISDIKNAVKKMREEIRTATTDRIYYKDIKGWY